MTITAQRLSFSYRRGSAVLRDLNFEFPSPAGGGGRVIAIMGPSGCGKSTLLRLLAGLETATSGSLSIDPPPGATPYLTQEAVLLPQYSRLKNARYRSFAGGHVSRFDESTFQQLRSTLRFDSGFFEDSQPLPAMSGGQRQRLALLRDLSVSPDLLLLDEPCNGLDQPLKVEFLQQLRQLVEKLPAIVFYVTHHWDEVELIADEVAFLSPVDGAQPQAMTVAPVRHAMHSPPSVAAASLLCHPVCNIVSCVVESDGRLNLPVHPFPGGLNAQLVFGVDAAHFSREGLPVNPACRTPSLTTVKMPGGEWVTLRSAAHARLKFGGRAWLFPRPDAAGQAVEIRSEPQDPLCVHYLHSL